MSTIFLIAATTTFLAILSAASMFLILSYLRITEKSAPHINSSIPVHGQQIEEGVNSHPPLRLLSVVITAKNEEEKIGRCISSLVNQSYKGVEIIVVDDNSTDRTQLIASDYAVRDSRVRVISAGPKPSDWIGKSWPCQKGFEASNGEIVLFIDADSILEPQAIELCLRRFEDSSLDVFSISPRTNLKGVWAYSTLPLVSTAINLLYPMSKVNDPKKSKRAYVFGTFVMIRRSVYESIGGHSTIRNRLVEDAAIAQLAKSKGYRLRLMIGDGLASTDWESDFKAVYHGMERVFSDSIRSYGLVSLLDAVLVFFLGLYPLLFLAGLAIYSSSLPHSLSLVYPSSSSSPLLILLLDAGLIASVVSLLLALSVCANELSLVKENRKVELFFAPFLYPIGTCLFIGAIITSTIKISRSRGFEWKGQKYEQKLAIRNR